MARLENSINKKVQERFSPIHLEVINESHNHNVPIDSETHFKLVVVSKGFEGSSRVARSRLVYDLLQDELDQGVHALALHLYTESQWAERAKESIVSPNCLGGSKV